MNLRVVCVLTIAVSRATIVQLNYILAPSGIGAVHSKNVILFLFIHCCSRCVCCFVLRPSFAVWFAVSIPV